mmetsp:Transcript_63783/g.152097  ORF Transcript_63783/g.152097 Transcript_63783/m.152097 type:complete len:336 (-) Transcript_63783:262-1269(-)
MLFIVALCLCSFPTLVSAARPKNAYDLEASDPATVSMHRSVAVEVGTAKQHWPSLNASSADLHSAALIEAADAGERTRTKLTADLGRCKEHAATVLARDYMKKATWTALKNAIQKLSNVGMRKGTWKKIGRKLALLETAAEAMTVLLTTIYESTADTVAADEDLQAAAVELVHNYVNPVGNGRAEPIGQFSGPMRKIILKAASAITKGFSQKKYAKHFEDFYVHLKRQVPDDVYPTGQTPRVKMAAVLNPMTEFLRDLLITGDGRTLLWKRLAERCLPDAHDYKASTEDEFTHTGYAITDEDLDFGDYMDDIEDAIEQLNIFPDPLPNPEWTATW